MKKLVFFALSLLLIGLVSCSKDDDPVIPTLDVKVPVLLFENKTENSIIDIETNALNWTATVNAAGQDWLTATPNQANKQIQVTASENTNLNKREAEITINASGLQVKVGVKQLGESPGILIESKSFSVSNNDTTINLKVVSNIDYDVNLFDSWITKDPKKLMTEKTVTLLVNRNGNKDRRNCEIHFQQKDGDVIEKLTIIQEGTEPYKPGDISDIKDDIKVQVISAYTTNFQPGGEIEKSFDGNMGTQYHSNWNNTANPLPVDLEYFFGEDAGYIDYLVYYPRTSGTNGNFGELEVWVATEENPTYEKYDDYDFGKSGSPAKVEFNPPLINPKSVKFHVKTGAGNFASCAEMQFYQKNAENVIPDVFADILCSALKPEVTIENIEAIGSSFYRNLAKSLYYGNYSTDYRIQTYKPYPHPDVFAAENKTNPFSLLDNPTGISAWIEDELIIFVDDLKGEKISLQIVNFEDGYGGTHYPLSSGVNKIKTTNRGLAYIMYHTANPAAEPVKIHIATGTVNGYFDKTKNTKEEWLTILNNAEEKHIDIIGEHAHLVFPVKSLKNYCTDGMRLIQIYDSIVKLEHEFIGLYKYDRISPNRMFFHVVYDNSHMYATSYRTAYAEGTLKGILNPAVLRTDEIWGPAHEVGHCNQTRPGFKWVGMTEVTNNVYSLWVQSSFGNKTRISDESLASEGYTNRYEKAFTTLVAKGLAHGEHDDVFCKLIPLWQLQLYYANVISTEKSKDFYKDLHEKVRTNANPASNGKAQLDFIKYCCDLAEQDLTDFFKAWGFLTPINKQIDDYGVQTLAITQSQIDEVLNYASRYNKPAHNLTYIHDDCINEYKNNAAIVKGTVSVTGSDIELTGWQNVVAYEVYDESDILQFVSPMVKFKTTTAITNPTIYAIAADGTKVKAD